MKPTKVQIESFLAQKHIALAGYSDKKSKFGHSVYEALLQKGYDVYPVNPKGGKTEKGKDVYKNIDELPEQVTALVAVTRPEVTEVIIEKAVEKGISHIWVQQMSDSAKVLELLKDHPLHITGKCIILHANPTGFHKLHWWVAKTFGLLPK
jgi:predicted CoA-binding protein